MNVDVPDAALIYKLSDTCYISIIWSNKLHLQIDIYGISYITHLSLFKATAN